MNLIRRIFELVRTGKTSDTDTVHGRVVYLLVLVALLHFIYPITIGGDTFNLIVYQLLYAGMFIAGILVASDSRPHLIAALATALIWFVCSVAYALDPTNKLKTFATYLALVPFLTTIIYLLYRYIFRRRAVNQDVLLAAVTVFILIGAFFVSIYGILELVEPGSFIDNMHPSQPAFWQQFVYFSFTTLTTTGYGDVVPVTPWARAVANVEMVIGVLYMAILMARLVGLYSQDT